jgi:hypothetical protein
MASSEESPDFAQEIISTLLSADRAVAESQSTQPEQPELLEMTPDEQPVLEPVPEPDFVTLSLAVEDVRAVLIQQQDLQKVALTQLNILFVVNTALLSVLSFSKLIFSQTWFSLIEIGGFLISFSLLINALVPRQVSVTPNPATIQSQIAKPANDYRQQLLRSFQKIYQSNQQRLDDVADSLVKASYTLWGILITALLHILATVLY